MASPSKPQNLAVPNADEQRLNQVAMAGLVLQDACFGQSFAMGWWTDPDTGKDLRDRDENSVRELFGMKNALVHSEVSESLEGLRKNSFDDHLPHLYTEEVEMADAVIRIMDYCGARGFNIGNAIAEKLAYNRTRADHQMANRQADGGKRV